MKLTIIFLLFSFSSLCQTPGYKIGTATADDFIYEYTLNKEGDYVINKIGRKKVKEIKKKQLCPLENEINNSKKNDSTELTSKLERERDSLKNFIDNILRIPKYRKSHVSFTTSEWNEIESIDCHIALLDTIHENNRKRATEMAKKKPFEKENNDVERKYYDFKADSALKVKRNLEERRDSLYRIYMLDYVKVKRSLFFGANRSRAFFDLMYSDVGKDFSFANTVGFNLGNNSGSLYSEIASGNLGIVRASLGLMISQSNDSDSTKAIERDAYQRLVSQGGNTVLKFEYPLYYLHSRDFRYNVISKLSSGFAADLPAFGTNTDAFAGNASMGIDLYGDLATDNNNLRFFVYSNLNIYSGTKQFQQNLGTINSNFLHGQFSVGVVVNNLVKISAVLFAFSSEPSLRNSNIIVGGQVLP